MRKAFALFAVAMVAFTLNAATPYMNLFVNSQITPSGSDTVCLTVKPGEEGYVRSQSENLGETVSIQAPLVRMVLNLAPMAATLRMAFMKLW